MNIRRALFALLLAVLVPGLASAQSLILSDDFEASGPTVDSAIWPGSSGSKVETGQSLFDVTNRYLHLQGAGVKVLSGNKSPDLIGKLSTFAFDFFEPVTSGDSVILGYAAGTSDINSAGAFVRLSVGNGLIALNATDGTFLTNQTSPAYPQGTPLTFSLVLNHSDINQPFNGTTIAPKTLEVWYVNWTNGQTQFALAVDVSTSTRTPAAVGFRTWSTLTNSGAYVDNVKLVDAALIVTPDFVPVASPATPVIPARSFVHPSILNTQQELERIKYRVNHQAGAVAVLGWNQLRGSSYASLSYTAVPYTNVVVMGSGTTPSETQYRNDSQAAYAAALQWVVTGDTRYRAKAIEIMNLWGSNFVTMSPASGTSTSQIQLESAWAAPIWVAAADIIRYYNNGAAGWSAAEIARFDNMLNYLYTQSALSASRDNNWGASAALAMISVGVYQNSRVRFDAGIQTYRDRLAGINAAVGNNGYINEVCRDTIHPQYTLQVWMQAAEIAWKNGIDLYNQTITSTSQPQFAINLENFARLFLGLDQPPCTVSFLTNYNYFDEQVHSGAYEIAYNHYTTRLGLPGLTNYNSMVVNRWRPGGFDAHFCGWSTLTHGGLSVGLPTAAAFGLWSNASNQFISTVSDGDTLNLRAFAPGYSLGVQTTGSVSSVQFQTNGTGFGSADTSAPFLFASWPRPGCYFLTAVPHQSFTNGTLPGDPLTRFARVVDLPAPWQVTDLGAPTVPAWASETNAAFRLNSAGTNLAGSRDQCGFVCVPMSGNVQLTARIVSVPASAGAAAGIMLRDSADPSARSIFLSLAGSGTNRLTMGSRLAYQTTSVITNFPVPAAPIWLRVVRIGGVVQCYTSSDAQTWSSRGAMHLPLNNDLLAGLVVVSGNASASSEASFDNVRVEPLNPSYAEWQNWMLTQQGITNFASPDADPDGDNLTNLGEFWLGTDPLSSNSQAGMTVAGTTNEHLRIRIMERKNAAGFGRQFQQSTNLVQWTVFAPDPVTDLADYGSQVWREMLVPLATGPCFVRAIYPAQP